MKVVMYARPWSVELFVALEEHWRARGESVEAIYIADHLKAVRIAREHGRDATFLPAAIRELSVPNPIAALQELEARYGERFLPFMRYLMAERMFVGKDRSWQIDQLARYAVFFDRLYETVCPQAIIGGAADTMPSWLAFDIARQHGCEPVGLMPSGIPANRVVMCEAYNDISGARERFARMRGAPLTEPQFGAARALQQIVLGHGTELSYLPPKRRAVELSRRILTGTAIWRQARFAFEQGQERRAGNWFYEPSPVLRWLAQPRRHARAKLADSRYLTEPPSGKPFVFLPLHLEPEAVLLIQSSYFGNQLEVIRNLARSLPIGWELVVKEHFSMRGQRRLSIYRQAAAIPNVRLAPFHCETHRLIQDAEVVAVIAGTAGLEASLIGQPVVMFGDTIWDFASTIHKVHRLADLPATIRAAAASRLGPDHPDVLAFAAAWDAALPPGRYFNNLGYSWLKAENVKRLAAAIWTAASGCEGPAQAEPALSTDQSPSG